MRQTEDSPLRDEVDGMEDFDEEEMIYVGDVDEIIDELEVESDCEKMEDDTNDVDDAFTVFRSHEKSVFCGSLTFDGKVAATGGEDDIAYIWDTSSGEIIHKCDGHQDSLIFAEFNHDNTYLATGDLSGIIKIWKMSGKTMVWDYNMGDASWMKWHHLANVLFAGSAEGEIYMWKIPSGECKVFQGYGQRTETAKVVADGKKLIAGYEDGSIRVMDLKEGTVQVTIAPGKAHSGVITDLDCQSDSKLIISAAVDGRTVLSTVQTGKIVSILQNLQEKKSSNEEANTDTDSECEKNWVEAVAFCKDPELCMAATGSIHGEIFIWDTVKQVIRHKVTQEYGVSKLVWRGISPFLYSAGLDGVVRCYDARTSQCIKTLYGHSKDVLDLYISKNDNKILTTSDDSTARIFDITNC